MSSFILAISFLMCQYTGSGFILTVKDSISHGGGREFGNCLCNCRLGAGECMAARV